MNFKQLSSTRFYCLVAVVFTIIMFSFLNAWTKEEGTIGDNVLLNWVADAFLIVQFPAIVIVEFLGWQDGSIFLAGLFVNALFYSIIINVLFRIVFKCKV